MIVTATSHFGSWQAGLADRHIISQNGEPLEALAHGLTGVTLITGRVKGDRTTPVDDHLLQWLYKFCGEHNIPLLIEADGARQKSLKAWAEHEPPVPPFVKQVVQVAGLSALGNALNEKIVHRADIFSEISGLASSDTITMEAILVALTHPAGGLKNIPHNARRTALLNQADTIELQSLAHGKVKDLLLAYDSVIISSLENKKIHAVHEPVAGIVLAAGESARYGQSKQLLDWRGEPFVRAVTRTALAAGLSPVIVVTGANAESVESALKDLDTRVVHNPDWKDGQGTSIRTGVRAIRSPLSLPQQSDFSIPLDEMEIGSGEAARRAEGAGAAIFLLADQPQVTSSILRALAEKHAEGLYPVVAPMVMERRANPVLFDSSTFRDLESLQGDVGGRAIFHKYKVEYLPWHDDRLLLDVDTPEMYQRLISDNTL